MQQEVIDKMITDSLNKEEIEYFNSLSEENVFKLWAGVYAGENGWFAVILSVFIFIYAGAAVYCGYRFFTVEATTEMLRYGAGMFLFMMFSAFLKLWIWNQMDKLSTLRELKRIEIRVAILMKKISDR